MTPADLRPDRLLFDTNILIHLARNDALARQVTADFDLAHRRQAPLVCVVTVGEALTLAIQWNWGTEKRERLRALIGHFVVTQLDLPGLVEAYARIRCHCRGIGAALGDNDVWIAATAHMTGAMLITTDADFDPLDPDFIAHRWIDPQTNHVKDGET